MGTGIQYILDTFDGYPLEYLEESFSCFKRYERWISVLYFSIPPLCGHIHVLLEHRKKGASSALKIQRMTYYQDPRFHGKYQRDSLIHAHSREYFGYTDLKYND